MNGSPLRSKIEAAVEALIDLLDGLDGDPDVELEPQESDGDDEDYDMVIFS